MGSPSIIDLQILTTPISSDNPTGENIRTHEHSSLYHRLKDARFAARTQERQSLETHLTDKKLWNEVFNLSIQVLQNISKDLEVCAWLIEALVRKYGYVGFRDGYRLINALITKFWDHLYPHPDEDGIFTKIAAFTGLNGQDKDGTLITPLSNVPFVESQYGSYCLWQYIQAQTIESISDPQKKEQQQKIWQISFDQFKDAIQNSSQTFLKNLISDIEESIEEYNRFDTLLTEKCQQDSPPTSNIQRVLKQSLDAIQSLTQNMFQNLNDDASAHTDNISSDDTAHTSQSRISSRQAAFNSLFKISEFFKQTEPHSPISYILARAIRWGQLSLPDLIAELINDERARAEYCLLAGIDPSSNENK